MTTTSMRVALVVLLTMGALAAQPATPPEGKMKKTITRAFDRVLGHVVDCGSDGLSEEAADDCVRSRLRKDQTRGAVQELERELPESNSKKRRVVERVREARAVRTAREKTAKRKAHRRFARRHPSSVLRLQRQKQRQQRKAQEEPAKAKQEVRDNMAAVELFHRYKPFVDKPEYSPQYDPDLIHRDVLGRSERFVARAGYKPRDALEISHINFDDLDPHKSPFPKNIEIAASMKSMKKQIVLEEKKMRQRREQRSAHMEYELDRQMRILAGKDPRPILMSSTDERIVKSQVHSVMQQVNPVANRAIREVLDHDISPPPAGSTRTLTETANAVARAVVRKVVNSTSEAMHMIQAAHKSAAKFHAGARLVEEALAKARTIRSRARQEARQMTKRIRVLRKKGLLKKLRKVANRTATDVFGNKRPRLGLEGLYNMSGDILRDDFLGNVSNFTTSATSVDGYIKQDKDKIRAWFNDTKNLKHLDHVTVNHTSARNGSKPIPDLAPELEAPVYYETEEEQVAVQQLSEQLPSAARKDLEQVESDGQPGYVELGASSANGS